MDQYINGTKLCNNENVNFNDWFSLEETKLMISLIEEILNIELVKLTNDEYFVHIDLVIKLAYWISPLFGFQINNLIRTTYINENNLKDEKIKLLENTYNKKQKRKDFKGSNMVYLITSKSNKNKRIYIVGKAKNLKNRLCGYNKTEKHELVYYSCCSNEENMVLNKLKAYKEQANRDRFVLPIDKDINLFTDIIDQSVEFIEKDNVII